jgi:hypothetical protein
MSDGPYRAERLQGFLPHTYFWAVVGPSNFTGRCSDDRSADVVAAELNRLHRELEAVRKVMETSDGPKEPTDDD